MIKSPVVWVVGPVMFSHKESPVSCIFHDLAAHDRMMNIDRLFIHIHLLSVQTRQQYSPRRKTTTGIVHLGKPDSHLCQLIQKGSMYLRTIRTDIRIAQIIRQNDHNIGCKTFVAFVRYRRLTTDQKHYGKYQCAENRINGTSDHPGGFCLSIVCKK